RSGPRGPHTQDGTFGASLFHPDERVIVGRLATVAPRGLIAGRAWCRTVARRRLRAPRLSHRRRTAERTKGTVIRSAVDQRTDGLAGADGCHAPPRPAVPLRSASGCGTTPRHVHPRRNPGRPPAARGRPADPGLGTGRGIRPPGGDRPRRYGGRLPRPAPAARPARRPQDHPRPPPRL